MPTFRIETDQGTFDIEADSEPTQEAALAAISSMGDVVTPQSPAAQQQGLEDQLRASIIQNAERPTSQRIQDMVLAGPNLLMKAGKGTLSMLSQVPELIDNPSTVLPTILESSRKAGMDIISQGLVNPTVEALATGRTPSALNLVNPLNNLISDLIPRTPSEREINTRVALDPLLKGIQEERAGIAFEGANPEISSFGAYAIPALIPGPKAVGSLKGLSASTPANVPRFVRSSLKPPNPQVGARVEKAAENTFGEIFTRNPNADKATPIAMEGFSQEVKALKKEVGGQISDLSRRNNTPVGGGPEIARDLRAQADLWEKAGQPAEDVAFLRKTAQEMEVINDLEPLQTAVTIANRKNSPLFQRTIQQTNPSRANVESVANEIISKTGGSKINSVLESLGGPEGGQLRKKWSDLTAIETEADKVVNRLINSAPEPIQPFIVQAASSLEGVVGISALLSGFGKAGIPAALAAVAKTWVRRAEKELKNSNAQISKAYDSFRKSPPPPPARPQAQVGATPPRLAPRELTFEEQIAQAIGGQGSTPPIINDALAAELLTQLGARPQALPAGTDLNTLIRALRAEQDVPLRLQDPNVGSNLGFPMN